MAVTSLTLMGNSADSLAPLLRPSPARGPDADMRDIEDSDSGNDADTCPCPQPQRGMKPPRRAGLMGGWYGHMSAYSIFRRQRNHAAGTPALATGLELRENVMLLQNQNAVIYGGGGAIGGAIGGAVARAFAREGARVFLSGRNTAQLEAVANDIKSEGRRMEP
jgi:hypothetical protein